MKQYSSKDLRNIINKLSEDNIGTFMGVVAWFQLHFDNDYFLYEKDKRRYFIDKAFNIELNWHKGASVNELRKQLYNAINATVKESAIKFLYKIGRAVVKGKDIKFIYGLAKNYLSIRDREILDRDIES